MMISPVLLILSMAALGASDSEPRTVLDLQQRVAARTALARVQHRHQEQATLSFDEAVPRQALERAVTDMLAQSAVLEALWGVRITAEMLQAEAARMALATRLPQRLAELHAALGNDPVLIQEALVRPALVSRLFHEKFDHDPAIQAAPRAEAEALAAALAAGTLDPALRHPRRREYDATGEQAGEAANASPGARHRLAVSGKVFDEPGAFVVRARLERGHRTTVVEYAVPRVTWQEWWPSNSARHATQPQLAVISGAGAVTRSLVTAPAQVDDCPSGNTWATSRLSFDGPITGAHAAFWTGSVFVVIASPTSMARFDPVLDTWLPMSLAGAPPGFRPAAVWSGSEVILYGGAVTWSSPMEEQHLGGRYNPITDQWTPFGSGVYSRTGATAVWTGSKMIIWGGQCSPATDAACAANPPSTQWTRYYGDGLAYDPAADTLAYLPQSLAGRIEHTAVWTGNRMIVYGGWHDFPVGVSTNGWATYDDGAIYDPAANAWTHIPASEVAQDRREHAAAWDGSGMYVVGGRSSHKGVNVFINEARNTLVRYDPATGLWEAHGSLPLYAPGETAIWTGRLLVTWGKVSGGRYDPATSSWSLLPVTGAPEVRQNAAIAWDGEAMFVNGGSTPNPFTYLSDGGRYFAEGGDVDLDEDGYTRCTGDCDEGDDAVNPGAVEACNGLDDDCDSSVDEDNPGGGVACGATDVGPCSLGVTECSSGTLICAGEVAPAPEICNGLDDDCDGASDQGNPGGGVSCGLDAGQCVPGLTACEDGALSCIGDVGPAPEICNGLDDDCDGDLPALEADADHDGHLACGGDCDDAAAGTHPGAIEFPGNLADENCDGAAACSPAMAWKNKGAYVLCVVNACVALVDAGQATAQQCLGAIATAARSGVGLQADSEDGREGYEEVAEP